MFTIRNNISIVNEPVSVCLTIEKKKLWLQKMRNFKHSYHNIYFIFMSQTDITWNKLEWLLFLTKCRKSFQNMLVIFKSTLYRVKEKFISPSMSLYKLFIAVKYVIKKYTSQQKILLSLNNLSGINYHRI